MTTDEWSCLISFAWAPLSCSERGGSKKIQNENISPSGFEPTPDPSQQVNRHERPLGHDNLTMIGGYCLT